MHGIGGDTLPSGEHACMPVLRRLNPLNTLSCFIQLWFSLIFHHMSLVFNILELLVEYSTSLGQISISKCDKGASSQAPNSGRVSRLDTEVTPSQNARHQLALALLDLRLKRALRRFRELIRQRSQRKCELRLFVVLRLEFLQRNRRRIRAAIKIQRFLRRILVHQRNTYFSRD
jgi:uncharacterized membrane protein